MALDPRSLRNAFGYYATGVAVVTTCTPSSERIGVTVNSFTSVSLDPPLVSFCLLNRANCYRVWREAAAFTVNVLSADQQRVANAFARPSGNPWEGVPVRAGGNGCAVLDGALSTVECVRFAHYPGGDHLIIVGRVTAVDAVTDQPPLLFYRGNYGTYWRGAFGAPPPDSSLSDLVLAGFG